MNPRILSSLALATALAACSQARAPDDAQLAALLRSERAPANAPAPPLDVNAVLCLRTWTDDASLTTGVPAPVAGEVGRKACRTRLEGWLADRARNPANFTFAEVDAPAVVKRAVALERERALAGLAANPHEVPAALAKRPAAAQVAPAAPGGDMVDLGTAGTDLAQAEDLCRQAQQKAADPAANARVKSFAHFCGNNLRQARANLETAARAGADPARLAALAAGARNMANIARNLLVLPNG